MSFEFGESLLRELAEKIVIQRTSELKSAIYAINDVSKQYFVANETITNVAAVDSSIKVQAQTVAPEQKPVTNVNVDFASGSAISANTSNIARSIVDDNQPNTPESEVEDRLAHLRSEAALHARPAEPIERGAGEIEGNGSVS